MAKPQNVDWSSDKSQGPDTQAPDDRHPTGSDGSEINPGTKPDAAAPVPAHNNPDAVDHAMIRGAGSNEQVGGRDESQVHAPTVSLHPTSQPQGDAAEAEEEVEYDIIDGASLKLNSSTVPEQSWVDLKYPFNELEYGQGMFIPVPKGGTTDKLMSDLHKQVDQYRKQNSEVEKDEDGDDVMEDVAINKKMRNEDGTVMLDGDKPRLGIKSGFRPKLIGPNFAVKAVVKGDIINDDEQEASSDGALVIRL